MEIDPFDPDQPQAMPQAPATNVDEAAHGGLGDRWVIGPPGTGKTTFLARQVEFDAQQRGSEAVVVCSHTRAAAAEIGQRHLPLDPDHVGTLHSLAYRALGRPTLLETGDGLKAFSEAYPRYEMSARYSMEDKEAGIGSRCEGDNYLAEYGRLRNLQVPRELWPTEVGAFAIAWEDYKQSGAGIDFTDMIELALAETDLPKPGTEVLICDEAQDLSRLQYGLVSRWAGNVPKCVLAFDADQSIYAFAGATPEVFLETEPRELKVLEQSWRVPRAVHAIALRWIRTASRRRDVTYLPRDADGEVGVSPSTWRVPERIIDDVEEDLRSGDGTVMLLAACGYMLAPIVAALRQRGIPFHNPYRVTNGAWNPFGSKHKATSTVGRVLMFLAPFAEDAKRFWTPSEVRLWSEIVVGCWKRGGKGRLRELPDDTDEMAVVSEVVAAMQTNEDAEAVTDGANATWWLRHRLAANRQNVGRYVLDVLEGWPREEIQRPRVVVGTIHSVKGGEADNVYLMPDLSPQGAMEWHGGGSGRDEVIRQFYVGMTRAREKLTFATPCGEAIGGYL